MAGFSDPSGAVVGETDKRPCDSPPVSLDLLPWVLSTTIVILPSACRLPHIPSLGRDEHLELSKANSLPSYRSSNSDAFLVPVRARTQRGDRVMVIRSL